MTLSVPYVPDETIEKDAQALLAEYAHARGVTIEAPIAIDEIIEKHLKIGIEFDDTHRLFGVPRSGIGFNPDILGAIFFEQKRIVIDESLDPDVNPAKEGRYRYTAAHEAGHWRLHRGLFGKDPAQGSLLDGAPPPSVICRSSQAKERVEWQADFYASCLLMPRKLVFAAWDEAFPDRKQRVLQPSEPIDHSFVEFGRETYVTPARVETETDDEALDRFATPFAKKFLVSPIAMRIRLEKLGLLHRETPVRSSMKRLDAANDNDAGKQVARTRQIWKPRLGRDLTDEDAHQIMHNVTGFFGVLAEWSRVEKLAAANDAAAPVKQNEGEVRHDR